jgi:hypothetical protein
LVHPATPYYQHSFGMHGANTNSVVAAGNSAGSSARNRDYLIATGSQGLPTAEIPAYDVATTSTSFAGEAQPFRVDPSSDRVQPTLILPAVENTQIFHVERGVVCVVQRIRVSTVVATI